ncbi:hypothetical protein EVAR_55284_1 [Eumeta japonica]|uniref:Uncharacterized protein n=1 Tax=Eumeta variegata TaxID=151549 RepID=A0A4C1ZIA8_EUMVA|nr:hypothetical protein EVAR_55284_1 [Eumeta japonica]
MQRESLNHMTRESSPWRTPVSVFVVMYWVTFSGASKYGPETAALRISSQGRDDAARISARHFHGRQDDP